MAVPLSRFADIRRPTGFLKLTAAAAASIGLFGGANGIQPAQAETHESHPLQCASDCVETLRGSSLQAGGNSIGVMELVTADLIYDPQSAKVYASLPSSAVPYSNSIVDIEPGTMTLGDPVFMGNDPAELAISDDSQYIYVALNGSWAVRRYNLSTGTAGLQFQIVSGGYTGLNIVEDIEVLPGNPGSVAISQRNIGYSPRHEGVVIYDNGVARPVRTEPHTGSNVIEFSSSSAILYGYNNESSEFGFRTMTVDGNGVTVANVTQQLITGYDVDIEFSAGLVYATSGAVMNPKNLVPAGNAPASGLVVPNPTLGRVFYLSERPDGWQLQAVDMATFALLDSLPIVGSGTASSLIRWGTDGLAFRSSSGHVYFVRACMARIDFGSDCDGVAQGGDNCPETANSGQEDGDLDGYGDACDDCPTTFDPSQTDTDGDLAGDACDAAGSGNLNCDGQIDAVDALIALRYGVGLGYAQSEPCLDLEEPLPGGAVMGDVDCSTTVSAVDALKILRVIAGLPVTVPPGCAAIKPQ